MVADKYSVKFENIFNFTRFFSEICGADIIKDNYKPGWKTLCVFLLINFSIALTFFTLYEEVIIKDNYDNLLKAGCVLGTALQGYTKLVNGLNKQNKYRFLYKEVHEMYKTYELKSLSYTKCLSNNIALVKKLLVAVFGAVLLTTILIIGTAIYILVILEERIEILPFQLPFLDKESDFGYYSTFVIQAICVVFAAFGNFVVDSWLFIYAAHIPLLKNILKCKFDDLNVILEAYPRDIARSSGSINDIFKWHQKYTNYCNVIRTAFFWVIFVQIGTEFFGIICTIICMFLGIWPPAPPYLLYLVSLVYSYCALGNLVEVANDDVIEMIYECRWYNLTVCEQKMIIIMLRESQQATGLSIGGIAPLSLNTALQLTKTIYTISMMLMEFLN